MEPSKFKKNFPKHGGDLKGFAAVAGFPLSEVVDFATNINPLGPSERVEVLYHRLAPEIKNYPDPYATDLVEALAKEHSLTSSQIMVGNGSLSLLDLVIRVLKPNRATLLEPCFSEYRRFLELSEAKIETIYLSEIDDFTFPFETIISSLQKTDLLLLGFPNNPTGTSLSFDQIKLLMETAEQTNTWFVVDEAFIDWRPEKSIVSLVTQYKKTILIRSLTKFYALAGIRVGYACANEATLSQIQKYQETWSCNIIAQKLGVVALADKPFREKSLKWFFEELSFMKKALSEIKGLKVYPTQANYFLCRLLEPQKQNNFWSELQKAGLYIREVSELPRLDKSYFRIALKERKENLFLLKVLRNILGCDVRPEGPPRNDKIKPKKILSLRRHPEERSDVRI